MKKIIIILAIFISIIIVSALSVALIIGSSSNKSKDLVFNLSGSDYTVELYQNSQSNPIKIFENNLRITLPYGNYHFVTEGDSIANSDTPLVINKDTETTININPPYSSEYLDSILNDKTVQDVNTSIKNQYPNIMNDYAIQNGRLFEQGQWYATVLVNKKSSNKNPLDIYRVVLKEENGKWNIAAKPNIVLTKYDNPDIPYAILQTINSTDTAYIPYNMSDHDE